MKCLLCDETRGLQNAHIIPKLLTREIINVDNDKVIMLCPSHHWYYDHDLLTDREKVILEPMVIYALYDLVQLYGTLTPHGEKDNEAVENLAKLKHKWWSWIIRMAGQFDV